MTYSLVHVDYRVNEWYQFSSQSVLAKLYMLRSLSIRATRILLQDVALVSVCM